MLETSSCAKTNAVTVPTNGVQENTAKSRSHDTSTAAFCRAARPPRRSTYECQQTRKKAGFFRVSFAGWGSYASFRVVDVVLRKVGRKPGRAVVGRLLRPPRKGSVVVIEFADGLHEYVTTPVKRVLQLCGQDTYYLQTANSRYRLEVRSDESGVVDQPVAN